MLRCCALALCLLLTGAAAQGPHTGAGPGSEPLSEEIQIQLFAEARAAAGALPPELEPRLLLELAEQERRLDPASAGEDATQAFQAATALPANGESADADQRRKLKQMVEEQAAGELLQLQGSAAVLGLIRQADIPRGPLYDLVLERLHGGQSNPGLAQQIWALVLECEQGDGSFPYRGVAALLRGPGLEPFTRRELAQAGYSWAAREEDASQIERAAALLEAGHRTVPELDGQLLASLHAMLTTLGAGLDRQQQIPSSAARQASRRLFALLRELDPAAAEARGQNFPSLIQPPGAGPSLTFRASEEGSGSAPADADSPSGSAQIEALTGRAEVLQRRDPGEALDAADQAASLLDADPVSGEASDAVRLAGVYARLGRVADAFRLLTGSLDAADRVGRQLDQDLLSPGADPEQQMEAAEGYSETAAAVRDIYSLAARVDGRTAAARAGAIPSKLLKPMLLLRVALVLQYGQPS